jgi:hypothetical protein
MIKISFSILCIFYMYVTFSPMHACLLLLGWHITVLSPPRDIIPALVKVKISLV